MNLYHHLAHAPHEQLRRIAHEFGVTAMSPSKRNLLHTISQRYRDPSFMVGLLEDVPAEVLGFLQALSCFTPQEDEKIQIPQSLVSLWCQEHTLVEHLEILQDKGFLFGEIHPLQQTVILPREVRSLVKSIVFSQENALQPVDAPPIPEQPFAHDLLDAVFHLLSVFNHFRAQLTQKGNVHKKIYERWAERCPQSIASEPLFNFVLAFCLNRELIIDGKDTYRPAPKCFDWLCQTNDAKRRDLWRYWIDSTVLPSRAYQNLFFLMISASGSDEETTSLVFSVDLLKSSYQKLYNTPAPNWLHTFQVLSALRLIRLDSNTEPHFFSYSQPGVVYLLGLTPEAPSLEPHPEPCILQPNFQLLVPPSVGYDRLWQLDQIAEFNRRDVFTDFHITQNRIMNAMRRGWTSEMVLKMLREYTADRIPTVVQVSVEEWTGKFGQIQLKKTVLVECASKDLADEIVHIPEVKAMLRERIADRYFAVEEVDARNLVRLLQDRGYEPAVNRKVDEERS